MLKWLVFGAVAGWAGAAAAADQPQYAPPPAWVQPVAIPEVPAGANGASDQLLLLDKQMRFAPDADRFYSEVAVKILTPQGLSPFANIPFSWSPDTDTLIFHRMNIIRGGQVIDLLSGGKKVTVIRRETNLELAMLDGELTATIQPEGLQVGDIVDSAVTIERRDPVLQGRSETALAIADFPGLIGRFHVRAAWPDAKPVNWRAAVGLPQPQITHEGGQTLLTVDAKELAAPKAPRDAPRRFSDVGVLEFSEFRNWSEVSALMAPLYAKAERLSDNSPLRLQADAIARASSDPKGRAEAALRLVEDQVHYVALAMNFGGYIPADANVTWTRRFGDCKGKSALLLALLHTLGIEAQPVMVNTQFGDGMDQRRPRLETFDHVIVRASIGGKTYWLDPTRIGDRGLDDIPTPDFRWVLPVRAAGASLENVAPPPYDKPAFENIERLDASAGLDRPAPAHVEQLYRGDDALGWRLSLDSAGRADAERNLREHFRKAIPWIEPRTVDYAYDEPGHLMRLTMDGVASMDWTNRSGLRDFDIGDSSLGFRASFTREPGPYADAPFAVAYPSYNRWTVIITLPDKGTGFSLIGGADVDQIIAGRHYLRRSRIDDGVVTMLAEDRSLTSEISATEAQAAVAPLRELVDYDVIVRGFTAPVTAGAGVASFATTAPTDAAGFAARGVGSLNRRDYDRAIADLDDAVRLEPTSAKYVYDRGVAHFYKGQFDLALQDFDAAVRLNPVDGLAYAARAELYLAMADLPRAKADFAQALKLSPDNMQVLERQASAYEAAGFFEAAVRGFDTAIARNAEPAQRGRLLNARCWARAEWGHELEAGLADCNAALALLPASSSVFDSRGFVRLRMGDDDKAIADYDEALRLAPGTATSLFGRGFAELRKGLKTEAARDIAAARSAAPAVQARFAWYGLVLPAEAKP